MHCDVDRAIRKFEKTGKVSLRARIRFFILRAMHKLVFWDICFFYRSKYGIKYFKTGRGHAKEELPARVGAEQHDPDSFLMPIDGLKDFCTQTGKPIRETYHYALIAASFRGKVGTCPYLKAEQEGFLDARDSLICSAESHLADFQKNLDAAKAGTLPPIRYYRVGEKKYVFDGKHRVALCAYLKMPVSAVEIPAASVSGKYADYLCRRCKNNRSFSVNYALVNSLAENRRAHPG